MRIVTEIAESFRLGGIEVNTLEDVRALATRGHEVHVVYGPDAYGRGELREELAAAGAILHGPHRLGWDPIRTVFDLAGYAPSRRVIERLRPDVLWLQRFEHALWARATAGAVKVPVVCHLHNAPNYRPQVQKALARGIAGFVAVSDFTRTQWVGRGLDPGSVEVLHNAIRPEDYPFGGPAEAHAARSALGLPIDVPVATYYGRFAAEKGIDVVLDAWQAVRTPQAHLLLLLVGPAPPAAGAAISRRVSDLVASGRATVLPVTSDVVPLLHASDVVLLPSREPEAFGRVALEALMTGRPVITTRLGGVTEVIPEGLDRLFVPPADAHALATALDNLLEWRLAEPGLGERCRASVRSRFPADQRLTDLERILGRHARSD